MWCVCDVGDVGVMCRLCVVCDMCMCVVYMCVCVCVCALYGLWRVCVRRCVMVTAGRSGGRVRKQEDTDGDSDQHLPTASFGTCPQECSGLETDEQGPGQPGGGTARWQRHSGLEGVWGRAPRGGGCAQI